MATKTTSNKKSAAQRQKALDRLKGDPSAARRPLAGYEAYYEVTAEGALYSLRLRRFLKPVFDTEKDAAAVEFEHEGKVVRMSPGKAVALSFFTPAQREQLAKEAQKMQPFDKVQEIKNHPAIAQLAEKTHVGTGAIFYILIKSLAKS